MSIQMPLCDMHTHSSFSPDAQSPLREMYRRACEMGLAVFAVTDHCDCNFWGQAAADTTTDREMYGAAEYALQSIATQREFIDNLLGEACGIKLVCGIELGQPLQNPEAAAVISENPAVDFIIGSHHQNRGLDDFYHLDYSAMTAKQINSLLDDAFCQTLEMCRRGGFDVLGHLTYPLRYICGEYGIEVDMREHEGTVREIFRTLIESGRGIELNTSGLRQRYGRTFPTLELLKLYRSLGGEILTLGSDAHRAADIAAGISDGQKLACEAGFKRIAYFEKRKAHFLEVRG